MNQKKAVWVLVLGMALLVSGCNKKATDQANLSSTGFENAGSQTELAQLPQVNATTAQQSGIEILPIETSPVTQGVPSALLTGANNDLSSMNGSTTAGTPTTATSPAPTSQNKKIQTALKNAGYYNGPIDGKIGPGSRKAVEAFQTSKGLKADGKVGPRTWKALEPFLSAPSSAAASAGATKVPEGN